MMRHQHGTDADIRINSDVSVVMPVLNEEQHLERAVESVLRQRHTGQIEVVLALGPSSDRTSEVAARLSDKDPRVRVIENPTGATASALNLAVAASTYPVVVRLDAHASLADDYIATAVAVLAETGADNVGGVMAAVGETDWESAVASAMTSVIGVGSAAYHVGGVAGPSSSVYLGCFRRDALTRVNGFDEKFKRAQDWELNYRLRASGGLVWFTPDLAVRYRPRASVRALAKQYFEYGRWRRAVMRSYPATKSLRYLAAPVAVATLFIALAALIAGSAVAFIYTRTSDDWPAWQIGSVPLPSALIFGALMVIATYLIGELIAGLYVARKQRWLVRALAPIALLTMHISWGFGFLTSPRQLSR
jgi:succinoglycan biosynthesis protein ExoA